jgi:hypothetical protein
MFVPTPNKMYCCVLTNVVLVYIYTTIIWPICPLQNITNLRLENSRQKLSPTKNSLQNLTYFQNVISNPERYGKVFFTLPRKAPRYSVNVAYTGCIKKNWTDLKLLAIDLSPLLSEILIYTSLDKNVITAWKSITKLVIFRSFVAKCCKMRII